MPDPTPTPDDRRARHLRRVAWEQSHKPDVFTGVPSFLRAALRTAARCPSGYHEPGLQHGRHVRSLDPIRVEAEDWERHVEEFVVPLAEAGDADGVLGWLVAHYPYVMQQVPRRRHDRYVEGFVVGLLEEE